MLGESSSFGLLPPSTATVVVSAAMVASNALGLTVMVSGSDLRRSNATCVLSSHSPQPSSVVAVIVPTPYSSFFTLSSTVALPARSATTRSSARRNEIRLLSGDADELSSCLCLAVGEVRHGLHRG